MQHQRKSSTHILKICQQELFLSKQNIVKCLHQGEFQRLTSVMFIQATNIYIFSLLCTRKKRKLRYRSIKWFYQYHTESISYLSRLQITPKFSSLKQLTFLKFLCIQHLAQFSWTLCFKDSLEGCSQGISRVGVSSESLHGEESPFQAHLYSCWQNPDS